MKHNQSGLVNQGVYAVFLNLPRQMEIEIGKLGRFSFLPGIYIYCGSAQKNLVSRIHRHQKREKPLRWHIDYLRLNSQYLGEIALPLAKMGECYLTQEFLKIPGAYYPVKGFGSSDCSCPAHLVYAPTCTLLE